MFSKEFAEGLPGLSVNCTKVVASAEALARSLSARRVKTEHLVMAILTASPPGRVVEWLNERNVTALKVEESLQERGLWDTNDQVCDGESVGMSDGLRRVKDVLKQFCASKVVDGERVFAKGLVPTEFLVAAILLEGTSVGNDMILRVGNGDITMRKCLEAINLDPNKVTICPAVEELEVVRLGASHGHIQYTPWWPEREKLPVIGEHFPLPPTEDSNWVIPEHLLIGQVPTNKDFINLVKVGKCRTFLSLIGEYGSLERMMMVSYPSTYKSSLKAVDILYYPIADFETTDPEELIGLVLELKRRLLNGEKLYVHCRGGHGRTGMVVVPLVAALYDISFDKAQQFVQNTHDISPRGKCWQAHIPETREQRAVGKEIWHKVTKRGR